MKTHTSATGRLWPVGVESGHLLCHLRNEKKRSGGERMKRFAALLIFVGSVALAQSQPPSPTIPKHVSKILSRADGRSKESAFKVKSIRQEYEVLEALGLQPGTQSLVVDKRPYDVFDATDRKIGEQREVWFDISSFAPF